MKRRKINYFKYFNLFFAIAALVSIAGCTGAPPTTPLINSFSAYPSTINEGESSTLSWSVTDATSVTINNAIGSVALTGTTAVDPIISTTYTLTATNGAGSVTATTIITVNPMATFTISQNEGAAKAWFGASPGYINVGQGQSFQVTEAGFFDQFQIYLSSTQSSTDSGDIIVCDLRDNSGNVLQSTSINGFLTDNEGWQIFNFNLGTYLTPGTYYCTCYISNPIEDHVYSIHGNNNDASYSGGTRYVSTGGNPEVWSSWFSESWDLLFKVIIKMIP